MQKKTLVLFLSSFTLQFLSAGEPFMFVKRVENNIDRCNLENILPDGSVEVLYNLDEHSARYIENFSRPEEIARISAKPVAAPISASAPESASTETGHDPLTDGIKKGLAESVRREVAALLTSQEPEEIINTKLIPALDVVGDGFEKNKVFLPQLLMSADAAKSAFDVIKEKLRTTGQQKKSPHKIVLATVHGDIHDIGKNIVKVLLENYGFDVLDLGKDVPEETVLQAVQDNNATLVGLSALMTTTVPAMERTIELVHKNTHAKVIVGGAVLTRSYAEMIHADHYAKDAMETVRLAKAHFGIE